MSLSVYYVDRTTGTVLWKLGGTPYNKDGATYIEVTGDPQTTFRMQHDARFLPNGDISLDIAMGGKESYREVKVPLSQFDIDVLRATTAK
jgi:hypothetical protein